ncbi:outer membrane protein assembly factor BamB family protein [Planctomicrobium piriforme]|uniref:Outer membrane protein assembly factor BamB, contains PQQ-like beta-propeller repeat n=1 Tax=Planctomicrobium piriforme TaxID=1576369 RepID=A0A1I3FSH6_9PLAN|nr:PQQ-binding-like beta-propeller repeat protein [Planctomicrobium piriforme]SFI14067.1 Outer membrane protein assembly factor BamB, contains PQQ-like beta-propeller repeat [Planctomicrobium piriforme]
MMSTPFRGCGNRLCRPWPILALAGLWFTLAASSASAQFGPPIIGLDPELAAAESQPARRLPRDPLTHASFLKAQEAIAGGDVVLGLETLQQLLEEDSDFFVIEGGVPKSLFQQIEQVLRQQNAEYERLFGPAARQLLTQARTEQNALQFEELVRRYGMTGAGAAALAELARIDRDRGEPTRAARELEQLASHPQTADQKSLLTEAARLLAATGNSAQALQLLQRTPALFPDQAANTALVARAAKQAGQIASTPRLYEWRLPYGDVDHISQTSPAPALNDTAWQVPLVHDVYDFWLLEAPDVGHRLGEDTRSLMTATEQRVRAPAERLAMPAARPLIVNNLAITSGPGSVKAFDLNTGELVWNGLVIDETFDYLTKWSYSAGEATDSVREEMRDLFAAVRGWRDLTSSSISTDGERVYSITNCQLVGTTSPQRMMQNTQRHPLLPQRSNRLIAYDLATEGKIVWPLRAAPTGVDDNPLGENREIFFLGAPLPVAGHLYVLGEERGQVQLFELDPTTGSILWTVGLLNPDRDLVMDDARRLAGLMPAYSDGLLICPTGEGSLTAVDPVKRQVVWTHFYASPSLLPFRSQNLMLRMIRPQSQAPLQSREELLGDQRWFDSRIMVAGPYVVFTPPDDDVLVCLNVRDGTSVLKERTPRGQMTYAATIFQDQLILVGRSEISCLSLSGGAPLWKRSVPIPAPSGRGVRMGDQYLQPLQTGEIAVIDLPAGRLLTRLPLPSGRIPGNLSSANGRLIVQYGNGLAGFQSLESLQKEIAQRLSQKTNDPQGLALRGAWELQQGDLQHGLADLNQSVSAAPAAVSQKVLIWSLLDGLRTDFAAYRAQAEKIEPALEGSEQRLQFLRTYAQGLQNAGEPAAAFNDYLKILQLLTWPEKLVDLDSRWAATDSRWVLARLEELLELPDPAMRNKLRTALAAWVQNSDPALLLKLLPGFGPDWVDPRLVVNRLAEIPLGNHNWHNREAVLRPLTASADPAVRATAAAQLVKLAVQTGDGETLRQMLAVLDASPARLPAPWQQSSADLARETRIEPRAAKLLNASIQWPQQVSLAEQQGSPGRSALYQIPLLGPASPALQGWTFFLDQAGVNIEIFDANGVHCGRVPTGYPGVRYAIDTDLGRYLCMQDHLVLIVMLDRFLLLDFLSDPRSPQLVVNRQISGEEDSLFNGRAAFSGQARVGLRSCLVELRPGRLGGNVGPLTDSIVCYSSGSDLIAINPITGNDLWRRRDLVAGSEVFGDKQYVVVKPPDQDVLQVYRAMDGALLFTRKLPAGVLTSLERMNGDWGRRLPIVENRPTDLVWSLYDPITDKADWSQTVPTGTRWSVVGGQDIAFYRPDQRLTVYSGHSGKPRFETRIPLMQKVEQFTLLEYPENWIFLTSTHRVDTIRRQAFGVRAHDLVLAEVDGQVSGLDRRDGRVLWSKEVATQDVVTQCPQRWPILVFARGRGRMESLILNRFTGAVIRSHSSPDDGTGISWLTETQPLRVQLKFAQDRVSLVFGDPPPMATGKKPATAPPQNESPN